MGHDGWYSRIFAAVYDPLLARTERETLAPLRKELLAGLTGVILDLGAGTGSNLAHLPAGEADRVIFLDSSFPMISRGLSKGMRHAGTPVIGTATALPFPDKTFDAVVATLVLCSVADLSAGLREIRRILKGGGTLRVMEHVLSDHPKMAALQRTGTPLWRRLAGGCHLDRTTDKMLREHFVPVSSRSLTIGRLPLHMGTYRTPPD